METSKNPTKKQTGVRLNMELIKQLKYLSVDLDRPLTDLFDEAVKDLLQKYKAKGKCSVSGH